MGQPDYTKTAIRNELKSVIKDMKKVKRNKKSAEDFRTIENLRKKNVFYVKADKGNSLVIMEKSDYENRMKDLIKENDYMVLNRDPLRQMVTKTKEIIARIVLVFKVWKKVSPVPVRYNRKADRQRHKHGGGSFVTLKPATLHGFIKEKPISESETVRICFSIKQFNQRPHDDDDGTKTVKNTGEKVKQVQRSSKSALAIHQQMAAENILMFGKPKGRMFSLNALRCAKYRMKNIQKLSDCPFTALMFLQATNTHADTIHMIGMNPLVVIYTSLNQMRLYGAYRKQSFGGVNRKPILLFSLCISDQFQISVHSSLTEKQDANFVKYWLEEFLRLGGSIPNEFICDMSAALLSAAVQAYGQKRSMLDYLNSLYNILNSINDVKPKCFVRIDIAHFIKDVATCNPLKNVRIKHRYFFIRSVALMLKMRSLSQIRNHILAVMVVASSQTEEQ
ncbi:NOF-FB transposable element [Pseudolycoriella hygida]|uniref:NOF-FB transposable element n=1 Tax=Pseudolycoriella hygida TaxID=35572 RepID=A0A9Q0S022_9DIPT|nr:NOF-FB transposable element [Pseudolycoriella hygida]